MSILVLAVSHYRSTFCILGLILIAGLYSSDKMPVEAQPEVAVPIVFTSVRLEGVSPEDAARLLVRPLEKEISSVANLDEMIGFGNESYAYVIAKFEAGSVDMDRALEDVRNAVDRSKAELPSDADEPIVEEMSAVDFPTITVALYAESGVQERTVFKTAQRLKRSIEGLEGVLEANMRGHREEVVEAQIDPSRLEHYKITSSDLINAIVANNLLVPAGNIESPTGLFSVKVPGLIERYQDVYSIPVKSTSDGVVSLGDITDIRRTFKDPESFTSFEGQPAILIEVVKRSEANQIAVTTRVRELINGSEGLVPPGVGIGYAFDQSDFSASILHEMIGNIVTAMMLVMIIVVAALGFRSGLLVGMGIPFSFLFALIPLSYMGFSFNMMVLFGMLLALGMLIDGSIVITEFADRKMAEGMSSRAAYQAAVRRMFWPVVASSATTLAAFLPMMFWPGVAGNFMRYLPLTVLWVLIGSLVYALFFAPIIGSLMGKSNTGFKIKKSIHDSGQNNPVALSGHTGMYARLLVRIVKYPVMALLCLVVALTSIVMLYGAKNAGTTFFTETEETWGLATVRAMGNLSIAEKRDIMLEVERIAMTVEGIKSTYAVSGSGASGSRVVAKDEIGVVMLELHKPSYLGYSTRTVFERVRQATADMAGIIVTAEPFEGGPPVGKALDIQLSALDGDKLLRSTRTLTLGLTQNIPHIRDITDSTPLPGIEWEVDVDRALAAQMGADVLEVGRAVQLVTSGVYLGEYRPDDSTEEVDIRVRYPVNHRGINALDELRINTVNGSVPISTFVHLKPRPKIDSIKRVDGIQVMNVYADMEQGHLVDDAVTNIKSWLAQNPLEPGVTVEFRGANEEQAKSLAFLSVAFSLALFLMFVLLVTQFNSFYQGFLILSSVVMSTTGVLLGLFLSQAVFSTILTGVGIVALAGIVVNNNIVLIDTYNVVRNQDHDLSSAEAVLIACAQRLRPVFLTTATTVLGLLPIALGISVDLMDRSIELNSVVTSYFIPLASAIVWGLMFSTVLTLIITPVMLVLPERLAQLFGVYLQPRLMPLWHLIDAVFQRFERFKKR